MYKYVWGNTCFILYTNSEDPDEKQHKVAFHQDLLHCSALPSARTEKHNLIYFTYPLQYIFGMKRVNSDCMLKSIQVLVKHGKLVQLR